MHTSFLTGLRHIVGSDAVLHDPPSVRDSFKLAADPHNRVFVVYLDTHFVRLDGSHEIRQPLLANRDCGSRVGESFKRAGQRRLGKTGGRTYGLTRLRSDRLSASQ